MLRVLALIMMFSAALDSTAVLADARQDCRTLRGDAAIQACDLVIGAFPRDAQAYKNRGDADLTKGDLDGVIVDYTKAIEINPKDSNAYSNRGYAYEMKRDFDRALADFSKAIEIDPEYADAYTNRCWLRATANRDLTLAFADCDTALRLAPDDANALDSRGFLYLRLDRLDEAIAVYDSALKADPRLADSLYGRGLSKRKKGDQAGGDADIAAARAIRTDIAAEYARYGLH